MRFNWSQCGVIHTLAIHRLGVMVTAEPCIISPDEWHVVFMSVSSVGWRGLDSGQMRREVEKMAARWLIQVADELLKGA